MEEMVIYGRVKHKIFQKNNDLSISEVAQHNMAAFLARTCEKYLTY